MNYLAEEKGRCSTPKYIVCKDAEANRMADWVIRKSLVQLDSEEWKDTFKGEPNEPDLGSET